MSSSLAESLWSTMAVISKSISYTLGAAVALLALVSPRSQKARFYLNVFLYVSSLGVCSVWGVVVSVLMNFVPGQRLNINYIVARSFYLLAGTLTGIRFTVEGEENFKKAQPGVLVGNHQTGIDILYLGRIFPKMASIMAKQELKLAPLLGQYMLLSGAVFIDRKSRKDAVKAFDQVGTAMKKNKLSLWIFPEGTRSNLPVPDLLPFKKGAFHLAVQAQVPVVPVVCENYNRLFDGKTRFEGGTIRIKVLEPIPTQGLGKDDVNELTERVRNVMLEALKEMDAQREQFDVSTAVDANTKSKGVAGGSSISSVPVNLGAGEAGLGGVAGWMAKLVGTGKGRDYNARARKQAEQLRKEGTSGEKPADYGLMSEGDKSRSSAHATALDDRVSGERRVQHDARSSSTGGSSEETEGSTVLVEAPTTS
ncbi:unnamed protein product [Parajaminaea phylloscopi]